MVKPATCRRVATLLVLVGGLLTTSCVDPGSSPGSATERVKPAAPKRIVVGLTGDPTNFSNRLNLGGIVPGVSDLEAFLHSGLAVSDDQSVLHPLLAETVPSLENGRWRLSPDGRMETTWTIKNGVTWQDGEPLTSNDMIFTAQVEQDTDLPIARNQAYASMDSIEARDAQTLVVNWKRPYIDADSFVGIAPLPLPKHLLEKPYADNKTGFVDLPYWTDEFVGAGPYKVKEFVRSSHLIMTAFDQYVPGRAKIDEVEMRFIPDFSTLGANILAGVVDIPLASGRLTLDWALGVRDQWRDGHMEVTSSTSWFTIFPQFLTPKPTAVTNLQFRRALYQAFDRQQLAKDLLAGVVPPADSIVLPSDPEYSHIRQSIVQYAYDSAQSARMLEGLGFTKGPDGTLRDAGGEPSAVQIRTVTAETQQKLALAIADSWHQLGINAEAYSIPLQQAGAADQYAVFPGFLLVRNPATFRALNGLTSRNSPVPENKFAGLNYGRFKSEDFDGLIDRLFVTVPFAERMDVLGQIVNFMTENLNVMGVVYNPNPALISNRLLNVAPAKPTWDVQDWDLR